VNIVDFEGNILFRDDIDIPDFKKFKAKDFKLCNDGKIKK
jgi:hypothetical protein